jgi:hypothetical protein
MIPPRYSSFVALLATSVVMSCIVSGVSTFANIGLAPGVFSAWLSAWASSWLVAFPALLFVVPMVQRLVSAFAAPGSSRITRG